MASSKPKKNLYETLGVKPEATPAELKRARRKKAAKAHPDHGGDPVEMSEINHAFDVLYDPSRRLLYDSTGEDSGASKESRSQALILQSLPKCAGEGCARDSNARTKVH